jgi:hypothetical protein
MKNERRGNTLRTTALVNEVYLRLIDVTKVDDAAHPGGRRSQSGRAQARRHGGQSELRGNGRLIPHSGSVHSGSTMRLAM